MSNIRVGDEVRVINSGQAYTSPRSTMARELSVSRYIQSGETPIQGKIYEVTGIIAHPSDRGECYCIVGAGSLYIINEEGIKKVSQFEQKVSEVYNV